MTINQWASSSEAYMFDFAMGYCPDSKYEIVKVEVKIL